METKLNDQKIKMRNRIFLFSLIIILSIFLQFLIFGFFIIPLFPSISAGIGENVSVATYLQIGNVFPEVLEVIINDGNSIDLIPNSTKRISIVVIARDYNGEDDINNVYLEFFDSSASYFGDDDSNNHHYTNESCVIDTGYGNEHEIMANCTLEVWYYANEGEWNASVIVNDTYGWEGFNSSVENINELLAIGLPESIDYGLVNATFVSDEQIANVTNYGNVNLNLSLSGYASSPGDGWAMNCTFGSIRNISIEYEKFNLTDSTSGPLTFPDFEDFYISLTSNPLIYDFDLPQRTSDLVNNAIKPSFWRIYVPIGVAGTCSGNIVFGATRDEAN